MDALVSNVTWADSVEALYRADAPRLWRALLAFAADDDIASEAVAEAFAQALRRGPVIRDPAAWIWRAAFRVAAGSVRARRDQREKTPRVSGFHADRYADPDLIAALRRLPDTQRAVVVLYYYADLPVSEIAVRLGSNALAVRASLSRGRRRLQELLGGRDD